MPDVYNPNVAKVDVIHMWDGQRVENTLYFYATTEPVYADLLSLATAVRDYWQANMLPLMSSQVAFMEVEVTKMEPVPAEYANVAALSPNIGADNNPALPNSVTLAVSFRTGLTGRSYRGRNYWLGLTEPNVTNNEVSPGLAVNIVAAYSGMSGAASIAPGWTWSVYSRIVNGVPRETGLSQDVTSVSIVDYTIDSQRRRLPGRGN